VTKILLRGGTVFDGVTSQRRKVSVLVGNGFIEKVGVNISTSEANHVLDIDGAWLTPGFIDPHSHADASLLSGANMDLRAFSGVTTEIVGQDGLGLSHSKGRGAEQMIEILTPIAGDMQHLLFSDVADYLGALDSGAFARAGTLSPHGTIRSEVIGRELNAASERQLGEMADAFARDMSAGALGLSTGLSYPPAIASDTDELVGMLTAVGPSTLYVTHLRSYGKEFGQSVDEALEIAERSRCRLHLSHFHVSGPGRRGQARTFLDILEKLPSLPTLDSYPYLHACTFLTSLLPPRFQSFSHNELRGIITQNIAAIATEVKAAGPEGTIAVGWAPLIFAGLAGSHKGWNGRSVEEICLESGLSPEKVILLAVSSEDYSPMVLVPQGIQENIVDVALSNLQVVGSDGIFGAGAPHPRISGSFFRFLKLVKDEVIPISLESAVAKMTSKTAKIFNLQLGAIAEGYPADLLVIDPEKISKGSDVLTTQPEALIHVLINGQFTLRDSRWLGIKLDNLALRGGR